MGAPFLAHVRALLGTYRYSLDAQETWKDGKLMGLRSTCNDDGTKHEVTLTSDGTTATGGKATPRRMRRPSRTAAAP